MIMESIEYLCSQYQYTIQALVALCTIAVSVISLYQSQLQWRIKIRGKLSIRFLIDRHGYIDPNVRIAGTYVKENDPAIIANIENICNLTIKIRNSCIYVERSFFKNMYWHISLPYMLSNPPMTKPHSFPYAIEPGSECILMDRFNKDALDKLKLDKLDKFLLRLYVFWPKAFVFTSNGKKLRLRMSGYFYKQLRQQLLSK